MRMRLCATLCQGQNNIEDTTHLTSFCESENIHPKMSKLNDIIKLSIGGQQFMTTRSTLVADQKSMLARMFENTHEASILPAASKDENGAYFIDRDPRVYSILYRSFSRVQIS